jgi:hypothetical protein
MAQRRPGWLHRHLALSMALALALGLSLLAYGAVRLSFADTACDIFLLGDSETDNFRLPRKQRLEDHIDAGLPAARSYNLAQAGAFVGDFFLRYERGRLQGVEPEVVVVLLSPTKFHPQSEVPGTVTNGPRLNQESSNLRWLPLSADGWRFWSSLTPGNRREAAVQKIALPFTGFYDALLPLWTDRVQAERLRATMLAGGPERERRIAADTRGIAEHWASRRVQLSDAEFEALDEARQLVFMQDLLARHGKALFVVLLPVGHPGLLDRHFAPLARAHLENARTQVLGWMERRGMRVIDLSGPADSDHFPASAWDDLHHLKSGTAMAHVAQRIAEQVGPAAAGRLQ